MELPKFEEGVAPVGGRNSVRRCKKRKRSGVYKRCDDDDIFPVDVRGCDMWRVLRAVGLLLNVVRYALWFGRDDCTARLLDVLLVHLAPDMSDGELLKVLGEFDWRGAACRAAVERGAAERWASRCWRLVAIARGRSERVCGEEVRMWWHCQSLVGHVRKAGEAVADCELVCDTQWILESGTLALRLHWGTGACRGRGSLMLDVDVVEGSREFLELFRHAWVSLRVSGDGCNCEAQPVVVNKSVAADERRNLQEFSNGRQCHGFFTVLAGHEFREWIRAHENICGLIASVELRFPKAQGKPS